MSIVRCDSWKVRGMFVSVLLALIAHSILSALALAILFAFSANPMSGRGSPKVSSYPCSVYRQMPESSFTDGMTERPYRR